jgi:putative phosphoribosyl transferase
MSYPTTPVGISYTEGSVTLDGDLEMPEGPRGVVVFAHGAGSSRGSVRNRHVARLLREGGMGTLLFDLLTRQEEAAVAAGGSPPDIEVLAHRLGAVTEWLLDDERTRELGIGYFGASTGAGVALAAAAERTEQVGAVVSRGGRTDLAEGVLGQVVAPTLLIAGELDLPVLRMNEAAAVALAGPVETEVVPGATHLFEEPGALDHVARLALDWFERYLAPPAPG